MGVDDDLSVTIQNEERKEKWQKNTKTLTDGFRHIYKTKEFADAVYVVNGEEFLVHRLLLAARSEVFKEKFFVPSPPSKIVDLGSTVGFKILIRYIYTDEIGTTNESDILEAYRVGKNFKQAELVAECKILMEGWTIMELNVFSKLNIALDIEYLCERCLKFIKQNNRKCLDSPDFKNVIPMALLVILQQNCFSEVSVGGLLDKVLKWGMDQFTELDDFSLLREFLIGNQILGELNLHKLSITELLELALNWPELLKPDEILKLQMSAMQPEKRLPLPDWVQR